MKFFTFFTIGLCSLLLGCASLDPGADPLVVRAEQTETGAVATLNLLVQQDDSNRQFWITNAPAFHNFVETQLRPTMTVTNTNGAVVLPRGLAILQQLDNVKQDYKASRADSNALTSAITVAASLVSQAAAWQTIVTNSVVPTSK